MSGSISGKAVWVIPISEHGGALASPRRHLASPHVRGSLASTSRFARRLSDTGPSESRLPPWPADRKYLDRRSRRTRNRIAHNPRYPCIVDVGNKGPRGILQLSGAITP